MHPSRNERRQRFIYWGGVVVGVGVLIGAFRNVDVTSLETLLGHLGWSLWLVPLPFALAQMTETLAWQLAFRAIGLRLGYLRLLRIRLACEGVAATFPGGMVIAESIKPGLLMRQFQIPAERAVCGTVARKVLLLVSQCGYFALAMALGARALSSAARTNPQAWWLPLAATVALVLLVLSALIVGLSLSRGDVCHQIHRRLTRLPFQWLQHLIERSRVSFLRTDSRLTEFFALGPKRLAPSTFVYLLSWLGESLETYTLLTLLGVHLSVSMILVIEVCASFVRNLAFLSPSGLGVQDLSYAGLIALFGVSNPINVAAAFVLLKRSKELLWSLLGYALLTTMSNRANRRTVPPSTFAWLHNSEEEPQAVHLGGDALRHARTAGR